MGLGINFRIQELNAKNIRKKDIRDTHQKYVKNKVPNITNEGMNGK